MTKLLTKPHIKGMVKAMKVAGLPVVTDWDAGVVKCEFKGKTIFFAIEKGRGNPWIMRCEDDLFVGVS